MERLVPYAPSVVRAGVSFVFLWFGLSQLVSPENWTAWLPAWVFNLPVKELSLIYLNGSFEVILGLSLLLGVFTRVSALLLSLHMLHITWTVGYNDIGVRDLGLAIATFGVFLFGPDRIALERRLRYAAP